MDASGDRYEETLRRWIAEFDGAVVVSWERVPGGASRLSYRAGTADGSRYFVRADRGVGPLSGTRYDLEREQQVISALHAQGFPVPAIHAWSPELNAILMEEVSGTSGPDGLEGLALQHALLQSIVELQQLPQGVSCFPESDTGMLVGEAIRAELEVWRELYQSRVTIPEPAIAFALEWLNAEIPDESQSAVTVHGDIGPGNFMFEGKTIHALIDWELAHPGHPLEDLACIIARSLGSPFGDNPLHVQVFGKLSGKSVDRSALEYCLVLVLTRFCVGIQMALSKPSPALDVPMLMLFRQVNLHALTGILAGHHGSSPPEQVSREAALPEVRGLYGYLGDTLQEVIAPEISGDPFLASKVRGLGALNRYLGALALYGTDNYAKEELELLDDLLRPAPSDLVAARHAFCEVIAGPEPPPVEMTLNYLVWRNQREQGLMSDALGPMAQRVLNY